MRPLNPVSHGISDYAFAVAFALAPWTFGFGGAARTLSDVLAVGFLLLALFSRYPPGLVRVLPFRVHALVEAVVAPAVALAPWWLGFRDQDRAVAFYAVAGLALGLLWFFTDYRLNRQARRERRVEQAEAWRRRRHA